MEDCICSQPKIEGAGNNDLSIAAANLWLLLQQRPILVGPGSSTTQSNDALGKHFAERSGRHPACVGERDSLRKGSIVTSPLTRRLIYDRWSEYGLRSIGFGSSWLKVVAAKTVGQGKWTRPIAA